MNCNSSPSSISKYVRLSLLLNLCIPPLIGLPSLRFYAVGSSLFLLSVCFCLCSLFYRDDVLCWLLLARPFLYAFHAHLRFPVDLVWFRLSCDHGWIRSGSVNVRKQQQQQQQSTIKSFSSGKKVDLLPQISERASKPPEYVSTGKLTIFPCSAHHKNIPSREFVSKSFFWGGG